jgi:hypothetical protein
MIGRSRLSGGDDSVSAELPRLRGGGDRRFSVIYRSPKIPIAGSGVFMLVLH